MRRVKLGEVALVEISGVDKKTNDGETPIILCNFTDVYKNWAITKDMRDSFMSASATQKEISRFTLKRGQVALTKDSETRDDIGIPTYIADDFEDVILGYHCALVTPDESQLDGSFLNAFLHTDYIQKFFSANASGSGQRYTLSVETLNSIPLLLPDIDEQKRIGKLFSDIDRKIALNNKIKDDLMAMSRQLFDYWFVQFDFPNSEGKPYKSSGGEMVWNEKLKRSIPHGWSACSLGDYLEMYQPQTLGLKDLPPDGKYRIYGANGIVGYYDRYNHTDSEIAMACRGNSCGTVNRTMPYSWITSNAMVMKMKNPKYHNEFVMQNCRYINIKGSITGSGQPQLTRENLSTVVSIAPSEDIMLKYSEAIAPLISKELSIISEIDTLLQFRNEILPLLMNGQCSL